MRRRRGAGGWSAREGAAKLRTSKNCGSRTVPGCGLGLGGLPRTAVSVFLG